MTWLCLSLACAFFAASTAALTKLLLRKQGEIFVMWAIYAASVPLFLLMFAFSPRPHPTALFWKTVLLMLPIEFAALFLYLKALRTSPISLVFPFLGLTPVFTLLTSSYILKERLPFFGIAGVAIVSAGAYLLNANTLKEGPLAPIKSIYREKGAMIMILVAFLYSVTSVLGKKAVMLSSALSFPAIYCGILLLIITPVALFGRRKPAIAITKKELYLVASLGIVFAASAFFHFAAISLVNVSYMMSIKRLSLVISVLYGAVFFGEKNIRFRLLGALVMFAGALVVSLAGR